MTEMFVWAVRRSAVRNLFLCLLLALGAAALLWWPQAAANGVRRGLSICASVIIPSIFPFLVLAGFLVSSGLSASIGRHLGGLTRVLFGLPGCCAAGILVGFVGGYPAGAAAVGELVRGGYITRQQGKRMLRFCVGGGPAFVLSAVGAGMLGSVTYGLLLLAAQWAAMLLIGVVSRFFERDTAEEAAPTPGKAPPASTALVQSVSGACQSLLVMCGFVLAGATVLSLWDAAGLPKQITLAISCLMEVSCGCLEASAAGSLTPLLLGLTMGWGGLSVHGQIAANLRGLELMDSSFFIARVAHGLVAGLISTMLFRAVPVTVSAFAPNAGVSVEPFATSSAVGGTALLFLCALHLLTLKTKPKEG